MRNRVLSVSLAVILGLSVGLVGCGGEEVPEITEYHLTISSTEGGSVTSPGEPGPYTYGEGEVVNLVAKADEGYQFVSWTGDVAEITDVEGSATLITMKDDYSVTATFAVRQYSLVVHSTQGGSVTTPGENAYTYDKGEVVNLVAVADEGYQFINWTGDVSTVADADATATIITMNGGYSITANFAVAIRDWYDLDAIRNNLDCSYVLMNDLDSTTVGYAELAGSAANDEKGWHPIGASDDGFIGSLNGQGYEVRDLSINRPNEDCVALFGYVGGVGVVENLGVVNVEVTGHRCVGGLAGQNCGSVGNSYSRGSVAGEYRGVGGLIGENVGTVSSSYSTCSVAGEGHVGGLVGANSGIVGGSYSTGSVSGEVNVGGLAGWQHGGTVSDCYSTSGVSGWGGVGGLVAANQDGTVSNSYYNYDEVLINGRYVVTIGALFNNDFEQWLANDKSLNVNERLSQEDGYYLIEDVSDFKQLLAFGQDSSLRFRVTDNLDLENDPDFYIPYLAGEFDGDGHRITNLSFDFDFVSPVGLFGYLASSGEVKELSAENVNITGYVGVGALVGENDGTVSNSYSTGRVAGEGSVGGLVGWIGWHGGTVINSYYDCEEVRINGSNIITIGALFAEDFEEWLTNDRSLDVSERLSLEDGYYLISDIGDFRQLLAFGQDSSLKFRLMNDLDLAGNPNFYIPYLAGEFDGNGHKISNLRFSLGSAGQVGLFGYLGPDGKVSEVGVENVNVTVTGAQQVGGLAGGSAGTVSDSYSTGNVAGESDAGGLVGWSIGTVSNSYSSASVTGRWAFGGLIGRGYHGIVDNSFWDTDTSGQIASAGGTGKTTAQMKDIATFSEAGWNIVTVVNFGTRDPAYIWNIVDGQTYPFFSSQSTT